MGTENQALAAGPTHCQLYPKDSRLSRAPLLCVYHLEPLEAGKQAEMLGDKCWPAARHSLTPALIYSHLSGFVFHISHVALFILFSYFALLFF